MDIDIVKNSWNALAGRRSQFVDQFYGRLFERYPDYRKLFPPEMGPQRERMVEMISSLALWADHMDLIEPYLENVGFAHRRTGIHTADVQNFTAVFLDTLAELHGSGWDERHASAWREVFDDVVIPMFEEGLERGRTETAPQG